jgi:hypothetical protein
LLPLATIIAMLPLFSPLARRRGSGAAGTVATLALLAALTTVAGPTLARTAREHLPEWEAAALRLQAVVSAWLVRWASAPPEAPPANFAVAPRPEPLRWDERPDLRPWAPLFPGQRFIDRHWDQWRPFRPVRYWPEVRGPHFRGAARFPR